METGFEFLEHTADVWVRCWGPTIESCIEQAALALLNTIGNPKRVQPAVTRTVEISAPDLETLVVDLLSEVLYLFDAEGLFFRELKIKGQIKREKSIVQARGELVGEKFAPDRHEPDTEVKAITYSYLVIEEGEGMSRLEIVFDI
ncbi:MAG: archease [Promethearchaeota archaeon]